MRTDERLRERELGVLDLLTRHGVASRFPEEEERRRRLGKFFHRPPGGESWADTGLRLRSWLRDVSLEHDGRRVLVVAHEVVVLMLRYVVEGLTEREILAVNRATDVANCSLTSFESTGSHLELTRFDHRHGRRP